MKTINQLIAQYIYNLFKLDVKIAIQHHFFNRAGAKVLPKENKIIFSLAALKNNIFPAYLIWHEIGHLKTSKIDRFCVENEVNAQVWAVKEAKKRGYHKLKKDFINYVKNWGNDSISSHSIIYSIAKFKILRKLNEKK
jgi:hypothetical protein